MLSTVPTVDTRAALCCLTPTPRTARRGESSPSPCSLRIDEQDQLLPPSLGYPLLGSCSLGTRACRALHNGSASAPTRPRLSMLSALWDQHAVRSTCHAPCQATGAPTSHRIRHDRRVALVHRGQGRSTDHAATVTSYRAQTYCLCSQNATYQIHVPHLCLPSTIKGSDQGRF